LRAAPLARNIVVAMHDRTLTVRLERIDALTPEISAYTFAHPWGRVLPPYEPGAHVDVHVPGGYLRQYSLARAAPPGACERYVIGVKREPASRGGSAAMHARLRVGDLVAVSTPRNHFPLQRGAAAHLLLAGGIGITPLLAMAEQLARDGADFTLAVFARSRAQLGFAEALAALGSRVRLHFDAAEAPEKLDLEGLLGQAPPGTHLYLCGPAGFMTRALEAARGWPEETLHREYFAAPGDAGGGQVDLPFELQLVQRGLRIPVAADQSAVDALHAFGIEVPTSCEQGLCGTCVVAWQGSGEPEHRDHCLTAGERRSRVALCCSRAKGGVLAVQL
jgi:vanillate O-demethylase ferredoxin subunit